MYSPNDLEALDLVELLKPLDSLVVKDKPPVEQPWCNGRMMVV